MHMIKLRDEKENVIKGSDFRSNVSLDTEPEKYELRT